MRYTDPTGHCWGPVIIICAGGAVALYLLAGGSVATQASTNAAQQSLSVTLPSPEQIEQQLLESPFGQAAAITAGIVAAVTNSGDAVTQSAFWRTQSAF